LHAGASPLLLQKAQKKFIDFINHPIYRYTFIGKNMKKIFIIKQHQPGYTGINQTV